MRELVSKKLDDVCALGAVDWGGDGPTGMGAASPEPEMARGGRDASMKRAVLITPSLW